MLNAKQTKKYKGQELYTLPDNYIVFDLETTGIDARNNEIIEIGALKVVDNKVIDTFNVLVKPNRLISDFITDLTGISNEMVSDAKSIEEVLPKFLEFIEDYTLIGHNVKFDLSFIYQFINLLGLNRITNNYIDTIKISKRVLPFLPGYKLSDLAKYYEIDETGHHRSLNDVKMTMELINHLKQDETKIIE